MTRNGNGRMAGWWSQRWFRWLQEIGISADSEADQAQPRGLRIQRLEVQMGTIDARVRDRELGDCRCQIELRTLNDEQWNTAIDALSEQALYAAQLLAGEMPSEIETVFQEAGVALLPEDRGELQHTCDCCPPQANPQSICRPLRAVYGALGEMLNEDPWLLFRLRGRDRQQILNGLRERRSRTASNGRDLASSLAQPRLAEEPAIFRPDEQAGELAGEDDALERNLEHFWGSSKPLGEFHHYIGPPTIELVALRRLGAPSFNQDSAQIYADLADIYRRTTETSLNVAFADEDVPDTGDGEEERLDEAEIFPED